MTYVYFIGIDIGKAFFDAGCSSRPHQTQQFANNPAGFEAFAEAYADKLAAALVVMEATGGYEAALLAWLLQKSIRVHRADPRAASYFIRSLGKRAKTDRLDALALARYGQERHADLPLARLQPASQAALESLLARRADLVEMRVAERNRLKHPRYGADLALSGSVKAVLKVLEAQIEAVHQAIEQLICQSPRLEAMLELMTSIPGIGRQTAYTLLAHMPELGALTRRQAASLAGCAPHPRDSGKTTGYRATAGGRATVKRALFMAALAARNFHPELKPFYNRLIQNGKKPMVALTAIMRKLIVILNAKLRDEVFSKTW
jgi:transposase